MAYQRAIEDVSGGTRDLAERSVLRPKPSLDEVMSQAQIEKKVEDYLRNSQALEDYWQRPITPDQLQAEMERIASHTKQPAGLRELFAALGNDPFVIAECLAATSRGRSFSRQRSCSRRRFILRMPTRLPALRKATNAKPPGDKLAAVTTLAQKSRPTCNTLPTTDNWTPSVVCAPRTMDSHQHHQRARCANQSARQSGPGKW